jgi:hypothetical protein
MEVRRLAAGSATETLSRKIPLSCDLDAAKFRERTSAMGLGRVKTPRHAITIEEVIRPRLP